MNRRDSSLILIRNTHWAGKPTVTERRREAGAGPGLLTATERASDTLETHYPLWLLERGPIGEKTREGPVTGHASLGTAVGS